MISPSTMMSLIDRIEEKIWDKFGTYKKVTRYIQRWHEDDEGSCNWENFTILTKNGSNIDLSSTLDTMGDELLFQIAVDLNIEVPNLIYSVAEIKGVLAEKYEDAAATFEKACNKVYSEPSTAIIMANSALEMIIKNICKKQKFIPYNPKDTLYKLTSTILKELKLFPDNKLDQNITQIGSGLLSVSKAIEVIRSKNTEAHGTEDVIISDPIYAMFIVNAVSTVGLFLLKYSENLPCENSIDEDDIPF